LLLLKWSVTFRIANCNFMYISDLFDPPPNLTLLEFYILLTVHLDIILVNNQLDSQFFSCMFISILYMFRAAMCPSWGELIVSVRHLVYVTLYRWPFGVQVWMRLQSHPKPHPNLHTKRSSTHRDIYQISYWYN
jgi:hypothetical protein